MAGEDLLATPDVFHDGPAAPIRIWSRLGRRPLVAGAEQALDRATAEGWTVISIKDDRNSVFA